MRHQPQTKDNWRRFTGADDKGFTLVYETGKSLTHALETKFVVYKDLLASLAGKRAKGEGLHKAHI